MKKAEVKIGESYYVRLHNHFTVVVLNSPCSYGGWNATNLNTGRSVRIKSAAKLRRVATPGDLQRHSRQPQHKEAV